MSNTPELLPCPFCGGEPSMVSEAENRHYVRCLSCDQQFEQTSSEYAASQFSRSLCHAWIHHFIPIDRTGPRRDKTRSRLWRVQR